MGYFLWECCCSKLLLLYCFSRSRKFEKQKLKRRTAKIEEILGEVNRQEKWASKKVRWEVGSDGLFLRLNYSPNDILGNNNKDLIRRDTLRRRRNLRSQNNPANGPGILQRNNIPYPVPPERDSRPVPAPIMRPTNDKFGPTLRLGPRRRGPPLQDSNIPEDNEQERLRTQRL